MARKAIPKSKFSNYLLTIKHKTMKLNLLLIFVLLGQLLSAQTFTEAPSSNIFEAVDESSIAFADVDGDNDKDVLITGKTLTGDPAISKLYINNGDGNFTEAIGTPFLVCIKDLLHLLI